MSHEHVPCVIHYTQGPGRKEIALAMRLREQGIAARG
jgi:hypothetical protein